MDGLRELLANHVLWVALAASAIAQMLKLLIDIAKHRKLNFRILVETGGMPSSHSALVTALATGVGLQRGWGQHRVRDRCRLCLHCHVRCRRGAPSSR